MSKVVPKSYRKYYCSECHKRISDYRHIYCKSCWQLGARNSNYKGGRTKYYCKQCKAEITYSSAKYKLGLCIKCGQKSRIKKISGENNVNWKGGKPNYIDCGKKLSSYKYTRCIYCARYFYAKRGKDSNFYGKRFRKRLIKYLQIHFDSSFEANFAKWCDLSGIKWKYEPKTFDLGNTTYTPDFYLPEFDCYIEIKGFWWGDAKEKFKKFQRHYPKLYIKVLYKKDLINLGILNV